MDPRTSGSIEIVLYLGLQIRRYERISILRHTNRPLDPIRGRGALVYCAYDDHAGQP